MLVSGGNLLYIPCSSHASAILVIKKVPSTSTTDYPVTVSGKRGSPRGKIIGSH